MMVRVETVIEYKSDLIMSLFLYGHYHFFFQMEKKIQIHGTK